ncbi:MAG: hypothetical protein GY946_05265 [bacterium]|nr:hypothetical protein [bacterium]
MNPHLHSLVLDGCPSPERDRPGISNTWPGGRVTLAAGHPAAQSLEMAKFFAALMTLLLHAVRSMTRSRAEVVLKNLALKQQVMVLKTRKPRPPLHDEHRAFWVALRSVWVGWTGPLMIVAPDTVVRWRRARFRRYWTRLSHGPRRPGRPRIDADIRKLIRRMAADND